MEELTELRKDVARLNQENIDFRRRLEKVEDNDERHEEDIRNLYAAHEGTKAYVTQILNKLDQMETKFFTLITNLTNNQDKDRAAERKERSSTTKTWIEVVKYLGAITLGSIIIYIVGGGLK